MSIRVGDILLVKGDPRRYKVDDINLCKYELSIYREDGMCYKPCYADVERGIRTGKVKIKGRNERRKLKRRELRWKAAKLRKRVSGILSNAMNLKGDK